MKTSKLYLVCAISLLMSSITFAQNKWSVELRPGINFPTEDFVDSNVETGFGFEVAGSYRFMDHLGAYAGWGYNTFKIENSDLDFDLTGYIFGLEFIHPIGTSEKLSYLLRGGGIYNHIEIENTDFDIVEDSGHGLGWELGVGLNYELGANWNLRPQFGYRELSRDVEFGESTSNVDVNYFVFAVGVAKIF